MLKKDDKLSKQVIITTSWDDGQKEDIKLLRLLDKYQIRGTFYTPFLFKGQPVKRLEDLKGYAAYGAEIGGHTVDHAPLDRLSDDQAYDQLKDCKKRLEGLLGKKVISFSYPNGKFNKKSSLLVKKAGYKLARTTVAFQTGFSNPFMMPTTLQFLPHKRLTHIKHGLKEVNILGLYDWATKFQLATDPMKLTELALEKITNEGGILHLWGHSWEIERYSLWNLLEKTLELISRKKGVKYLTNGQLLG